MTPLQTAARFAAFVWYTESRKAQRRVVQREARRFADDHWQAFLPVANEGLGRLLMRISKPGKGRRRRSGAPARRTSSEKCGRQPALIG